jgi:hypothetical protein
MTYNNVDCIHVFLILACLVSAATSHMRDTLLAHFTRPALGQVFMVFCICFNNVPNLPHMMLRLILTSRTSCARGLKVGVVGRET